MFYDTAKDYHEFLSGKILQLQDRLLSFPGHDLSCYNNGSYTKWYISDGKRAAYLPKANHHELAQVLAEKKLLNARLNDLISEEQALSAYLCRHEAYQPKYPPMLLPDSPYYELIHHLLSAPPANSLNEELQAWASADYPRNPYLPEKLIHKTAGGLYVRSKSEAMIASALFRKNVPFRYECELVLKGKSIYPDFTIRHPLSGKLFYWEHLGMADELGYLKKNLEKVYFYAEEGIFVNDNLILTYETKDAPLSEEMVDLLIRHYFE